MFLYEGGAFRVVAQKDAPAAGQDGVVANGSDRGVVAKGMNIGADAEGGMGVVATGNADERYSRQTPYAGSLGSVTQGKRRSAMWRPL
jgi:hypothetical protein